MAKIYAKANRIVVWLGERAPGSDQAMEEIRHAAEWGLTRPSTDKSIMQSVLALLQRPWFQRIWVRN
jgi:Heterokaryon incompatibility protein (HET)